MIDTTLNSCEDYLAVCKFFRELWHLGYLTFDEYCANANSIAGPIAHNDVNTEHCYRR